jgi:nucleotide-binding universal stress UspA family protein
MQSLRHILVGTDFGPAAESALRSAITLANLGLAKITLVHVCELTSAGGALEDEYLRRCERRLATEVERHAQCGVEIKGLLRAGRPWEKLNNAATEVGANLIVVGRGAGGLGEVPGRLLQTTSRPVLLVGTEAP